MKKEKTAEKEVKVEEEENIKTINIDEVNNEKEVEEAEEQEELSELDKSKAELAEAKDKYLRLYSEFENYRRRTSKEKLDLIQTATEGLIGSLLPIIDDFERAEKSISKDSDVKSVQEGMTLIANKFNNALVQKGLKVMESKQGIAFDPEIHEAITQIPAPKAKLKGKVVDVVEKGYFLGEKVVRFAKVVIGN
jgi:molecular chaperone GrpE